MLWKTALGAVLCFSPLWATADSDVTNDPTDLMQAMLKMGTAMATSKVAEPGTATDPRLDMLLKGMKTISAMSAAKEGAAKEAENADKVFQQTMSLVSEAKEAEGTKDAEEMVESKTMKKHMSRRAKKASEAAAAAAAEEAAGVKLIEDAKQAEEEKKTQEQEAAKKKRDQFMSMVKFGGEALKKMTDSTSAAAPEGSSNPVNDIMKAFMGSVAPSEGSSNPMKDLMKGLGGDTSKSAESKNTKENILKLFRGERSSDNTQNMPGGDVMKAFMGSGRNDDDASTHDALSNSGLNMMKSIMGGNKDIPKQDEAGMMNWLMNN